MEGISHKICAKKNIIRENGLSPVTTTASPDASSTTSDTPTPPNGIHDKNWVSRYQSIGGMCIFTFHSLMRYSSVCLRFLLDICSL